MSTDGGSPWTEPIQMDLTPTDIDADNRRSFLASLAIAANGTLGVTYYDFRHNIVSEPALLTDVFLVTCQHDCSNRVNWRDEVRLTDESFNFEQAPFGGRLFLGDYHSLVTDDDDFLAFFAQPHDRVSRLNVPPTRHANEMKPSSTTLAESALAGLHFVFRRRRLSATPHWIL